MSPMRRSYSRISSARASSSSRASPSSFSSVAARACSASKRMRWLVSSCSCRSLASSRAVTSRARSMLDFGEIGFDVTQAALHGVEARFGFGQLARQARGFGARLVEQDLLRALFVLGHQQALARGVEVGFERDDALVGGDQPFVEAAVLLAQRDGISPVSCARRDFQIGDLGARGRRYRWRSRPWWFPAVRSRLCVVARSWRSAWHSLSDGGQLLLEVADLVAQLAVGGAGIVEHRLQADLLGLLGLEVAQRLADRIDQLADRGLDGVEFVDLALASSSRLRSASFSPPIWAPSAENNSSSSSSGLSACGCWLVRLFGAGRAACGRESQICSWQ